MYACWRYVTAPPDTDITCPFCNVTGICVSSQLYAEMEVGTEFKFLWLQKIFALSAVTSLNKLSAVWHPGGSLSPMHHSLHIYRCALQCKTLIHIHRSCKADHAVLWHR